MRKERYQVSSTTARATADLRPRTTELIQKVPAPNKSCTDTYVRSKPKIVRGGKLIQQAK
jgi:hypothetical protein